MWGKGCAGALLALGLCGCTGGLDPAMVPVEAKISGTVWFRGPWPPPDSLLDLRVVAFQVYPPTNVLEEVLGGRALFSERLPAAPSVERASYEITVPQPPMVFRYIIVAQQYGPDIFRHWRVIGVYTRDTVSYRPDSLWVEPGGVYPNVNIQVDFERLPPQPFP
ncbi:hypothetical protein HRbin21_00294 [bacterium HR21]|nr:hypothetical protein HRbin21_00294 [bacterium HR21]